MSLRSQLTSILDVFSRRHSPKRQGYKPDEASETFRNRILLLYREFLSGHWRSRHRAPGDYTQEFWEDMARRLQHLHGKPKLSEARTRSAAEDTLNFVFTCEPAHFFDFLELTFKVDCIWRFDQNELVDAVNEVFRVEDAPYQLTPLVTEELKREGKYGGGTYIETVALPKVIRVEDEVVHSEAVAPALSALSAPHFKAANLEFRGALDEYRRGHFGDCLTKCCSSFESVMKSLCKRNNWPVDEKRDTAASLLKVVLSNSKLDSFFEQPLMLIATMRNRLSSSHGGGSAPRSVERHIAQYALTSTAAAILLLAHELDETG